MRARMLEIENKVSGLDLGMNYKELLDDAFYELALTNPQAVQE